MPLITRNVSNVGDALTAPDGAVLAGKQITFALVTSAGVVIDAFDATTGERVVGKVTAVTNSLGEFTAALWPNDRGGSVTQYLCQVDVPGVADFQASVATGGATLQWIDFKAAGTPLAAIGGTGQFNQNTATTTGLTYGYSGGLIRADNVVTTVADGTVALTANLTNYIEVTSAGSVSANTTAFTSGRFPMATVLAGASTITTVTDKRGFAATSRTAIVGITGTKAQFNTAVTDGDIVYLDSVDTITGVKSFNDGTLSVKGAISGNVLIKAPPVAGTDTVLYFKNVPLQSGVPTALQSSGTVGANGVLSGITALPATYSGGIYLYFPAGRLYAGSLAGSYPAIMSSTTAGTVYNNMYSGGKLTIPASLTPIVDAGPGAYTQSTAVDISLVYGTSTGNSMGPNGTVWLYPIWHYPSSANVKTLKMLFGGTAVIAIGNTTSTYAAPLVRVWNKGVTNQQSASDFGGLSNSSTATISHLTKDTTADQAILITAQLAVATEYVILAHHNVFVEYAP